MYSATHPHCSAYISNMVHSVATSISSWSPIFHIPNIRRTKNSYETWGAFVLSFKTCGVERIDSQYPQHYPPKTIRTAVKDIF